MFKGAKLSQDLSVTKSYFECSVWILRVMHTASYNREKKKEQFWCWCRFAFYYKDINVLSQMEGTHTFSGWRTQYKALEGEHTLHYQILRANSTHRTDLKGVKIGSSASKTCKLCTIGSPAICSFTVKKYCAAVKPVTQYSVILNYSHYYKMIHTCITRWCIHTSTWQYSN